MTAGSVCRCPVRPGTSLRRRSLMTPWWGALERAQRVELRWGGRGDDLWLGRDGQVPAGPLFRGRGGDSRVQPGQGELERLRIGLEDAQVSDDLLGPGAGEAQPLPVTGARSVADGGHEVHPLDERPATLPDHDDHLTTRGGDLWCAARAGQAYLGITVVAANSGRVDVAELVDLSGAEET